MTEENGGGGGSEPVSDEYFIGLAINGNARMTHRIIKVTLYSLTQAIPLKDTLLQSWLPLTYKQSFCHYLWHYALGLLSTQLYFIIYVLPNTAFLLLVIPKVTPIRIMLFFCFNAPVYLLKECLMTILIYGTPCLMPIQFGDRYHFIYDAE